MAKNKKAGAKKTGEKKSSGSKAGKTVAAMKINPATGLEIVQDKDRFLQPAKK